MNHLTILKMVGPWKFLEQRKKRYKGSIQILAITSRGTGQVIALSREGLAFGCLYPHKFPDSWLIDIIDARGLYIKQLHVKKMWERNIGYQELTTDFELEVGVEFTELTALQAAELDFLLDNSEFIDVHPN